MNNYTILKNSIFNLRAAVIERAIMDYREALRQGDFPMAWEIEGFFLSEGGQAYTRGNGEKIIERIRKEVGINETGRINDEDTY